MPAFLFAEFDSPLDGGAKLDAAAYQALYSLRDPLERALLSHGCQWMKPQGHRLLAVLEPRQVLGALIAAMEEFAAAARGDEPPPIKWVAHCGEAFHGATGWYGPEVDHAQRLLDAVSPGFPILSEAASRLPLPEGYHRMSLGMHLLKDLRPSEELFALHSTEQTRMDFAIPKSMGAYRHNLPAQPTPFFGRNDMMRDLEKRLLGPKTRMVTLLGPGGFGKTRLALQVSADLVDRFDGVFWVPLAPLTSEERLTSALADSLGVVFYQGEDPFQKVLEVLADRKCLLLFDNFEHLTGGRGYVRQILEKTGTHVIVTSREALRIPQEDVVELTGLKFPDREDDPLFDEYGATQLFVSSLSRAGRTAPLTPEERTAFLDLCRQLHGMPLGIEMSAFLTLNHPLPEIVEQIRHRIDYLAVSLPHLPDRQKSTRAVFEYSWNLLEESLRKALARLSIIRGGFEEEAARQVAQCDAQALKSLQDRSLLVSLPDGRKMLHETVRYYAKEHLYEEPQDRERTLEAHARFYLMYLRNSLRGFEGRDQRQHLEAAAEHGENIQAAFLWAVENLQWDLADQGLEAYELLLERLAKFRDGHTFLTQLLRNLQDREDGRQEAVRQLFRADLLTYRAALGVRMGLIEGLETDLGEALQVFQGKVFERRNAQALLVLGQVLEARGKKAESLEHLSHSLAQFESCGDLDGAAYARNRLGQGLLQWRQVATAEGLVRSALAHYEATDNPSGMAWSRMLLGQMSIMESKYDEAKRHFREGLEGYLTVGNRDGVSWAMNMMGQVAKVRGDYAGADQLFKEALSIEDEISNHAAQGWTHVHLAETEWFLGRPEQAERHLRKAREVYGHIADPAGIASVLRVSGLIALETGDSDAAEKLFQEAEEKAPSRSDVVAGAWQHYRLSRVARLRGRSKDAEREAGEAVQAFIKARHFYGQAWSHHLAAELALSTGNLAEAAERIRLSLGIAKDLRLPPVHLEGWLVWAAILAAEGRHREAVEWAVAVSRHPAASKPLSQKALQRREEWEAKIDPEEKLYAHQVATTAELDAWTDRILEKAAPPRVQAAAGAAKKPKPKKSPRPVRRKK